MTIDITERQKLLLKAIIEEFMHTAEAVGSLSLPKKYNIKASSATIRNEMAKLVKAGFLSKPHSSSGRIPTTYGIKYYLQELLNELEELDHSQEIEIREDLHQKRFDSQNLITQAIKYLSELTHNTALAIIHNHIYYAGLAAMLDYPEFQELSKLRSIIEIFEDYSLVLSLFEKYDGSNIQILIGEETGFKNFQNYAVVFTKINLYDNQSGYLGIIGPNRMNYSHVIPAIKCIANNIESVVKGW